MNLADVVEEVGAELDTINGLRVYPYAADRITPPAAVLGWPEITYGQTMRQGMDRYDLPLYIVVGKASDRAALKNIAPYLDGGNAGSVRALLEARTTAMTWLSFDSLTVGPGPAVPIEFMVGAVVYLAYLFSLDIAGQGAA